MNESKEDKNVENNKIVVACNKKLNEIPDDYINKYGKSLEFLDLSNNYLKSVEKVHYFKRLKNLILDFNEIEFLPKNVSLMVKLEKLSLNNNKIKNVEILLERLKGLKNLRDLSINNNPGLPEKYNNKSFSSEDYTRNFLYFLYHLPNLKYFDGKEIEKNERILAKKHGFFKVRKINIPDSVITESNIVEDNIKIESHSYFGYQKKSYLGLNSQGNRFIKDL